MNKKNVRTGKFFTCCKRIRAREKERRTLSERERVTGTQREGQRQRHAEEGTETDNGTE